MREACAFNRRSWRLKLYQERTQNTMTQYQLANAAEKIDGYFYPRSCDLAERQRKAFERAQSECVGHLTDQLNAVAGLTFAQFMTATKRGKLHDAEVTSKEEPAA